jgi:hypothetical protein
MESRKYQRKELRLLPNPNGMTLSFLSLVSSGFLTAMDIRAFFGLGARQKRDWAACSRQQGAGRNAESAAYSAKWQSVGARRFAMRSTRRKRWVSRRVQLPVDHTQLRARGVVAGFTKAREFFKPHFPDVAALYPNAPLTKLLFGVSHSRRSDLGNCSQPL